MALRVNSRPGDRWAGDIDVVVGQISSGCIVGWWIVWIVWMDQMDAYLDSYSTAIDIYGGSLLAALIRRWQVIVLDGSMDGSIDGAMG